MTNRWFSVNTHNRNNNCFEKEDVKNFGFREWQEEWRTKAKKLEAVEKRTCNSNETGDLGSNHHHDKHRGKNHHHHDKHHKHHHDKHHHKDHHKNKQHLADEIALENSSSCQSCSQASGCSGQQCQTLARDREYYKLGPLKHGCAAGSITGHLYTFPLPLDYGYWPDINTKLNPWARVP